MVKTSSKKIRSEIILLLIFCLNIGCDFNSDSKYKKNNFGKKEEQIAKKQFVSDTLKKIIDDLNLCSGIEAWNANVPGLFDCYEKDVLKIQAIKKGDRNYNYFIFQSVGGSGGATIVIYSKSEGQYKIIQEDYGYVSTVLKTTTNGFYDLIIWHREQKAGGVEALYKWNGKKYLKTKVVKDYSVVSHKVCKAEKLF